MLSYMPNGVSIKRGIYGVSNGNLRDKISNNLPSGK